MIKSNRRDVAARKGRYHMSRPLLFNRQSLRICICMSRQKVKTKLGGDACSCAGGGRCASRFVLGRAGKQCVHVKG